MENLQSTEFNGYPIYLPKSNEILLATTEIEGENLAAYYQHGYCNVAIGTVSDGTTIPKLTTDENSNLIGEQVRELIEDVGDKANVSLSLIGEALYNAHLLAQTDILTPKQAYIYTLSEFYEFDNKQIRIILNTSKEEITDVVDEVAEKVYHTRELVRILEDIKESIQ